MEILQVLMPIFMSHRGEVAVGHAQTFQADGELDITRPDNVLNLELLQLMHEQCDINKL